MTKKVKIGELIPYLLVILLYGRGIKNDFVWDDFPFILENILLKDLANIPSYFLMGMPTIRESVHYRPLTMIFMALQYNFFSTNPLYYHLFSIFLHILSVFLVYRLLIHIVGEKKYSLLGSLFFALHPVHVDAVAWISGFVDPLCAVFIFSSFLFFIKFTRQKKNVYFVLSLIFFTLALFTKEMAILFPIIYFLYLIIYLDKEDRKRFYVFVLCYIIPLIVYSFLRLKALEKPFGNSFHFHLHIYYAVINYVRYIIFILNPYALKIINYDIHPNSTISLFKFIASLLVSLILFLVAFIFRRSNKNIFFAVLYFFISLIPVVGIISVGNIYHRYLYIPIFGFALICTEGLRALNSFRIRKLEILLGVIIFGFLFYHSYLRIGYYKDNFTFFSIVAKETPNYDGSYIHLFKYYFDKGDYVMAEKMCLEAIKIRGKFSDRAYTLLGMIYIELGRYDKAEESLFEALRINNKNDDAYSELGVLYYHKEEHERAYNFMQKAILINPYNSSHYNNLGVLLINLKQYDEAFNAVKKGLKLNPTNIDLLNLLGIIYAESRNYEEAKKAFEKAISLNPQDTLTQKNYDRLLQIMKEPKFDKSN